MAAVATLVFVLTLVGLIMHREIGQLAVVWPSNAVVVAFLLRSRRPMWPSIILAGLSANFLAKLVIGTHWAPGLVLPLCNSLEIWLCAAISLRFTGPDIDLSKPSHLRIFAVVAGLAAPLISALVEAVILLALNHEPLVDNIVSWWSTDALGLVIITPALLVLTPQGLSALGGRLVTPGGALSAVALLGSIGFGFGQNHLPGLFLVPAALIFCAFELGQAGAALALLITALASTALAVNGHTTASMSRLNFRDGLLALQAFLATMTMLVLPVAAVLASRTRLEADLRRKQTETAAALVQLAEGEARYRLLTERTVDVIVRYDLAGRIHYISPSVGQYGHHPEAMIGRQILDFVHPDDAGDVMRRVVDLVSGQSLPSGAQNLFRLLRGDDGWAYMEGSPAPILDPDGKAVGVVTVLRDVTERREMEAELHRRAEAAEAASIAKSEFLANMSHEIRTPLTAIVGFAGLLSAAEDLSDKARAYVDRINRGGHALLAIVNDVLDFSKMEAGQFELDPRPFAPEALLRETLDLVADQAAAKGLTLASEVGALPAFVIADSARLSQVLINLLSNAIKFTGQGGVTVRAEYRQDPRDPEAGVLGFAVTDTGMGVPEALRHRLFQRFSQVDSSNTRQFGGTGLGLSICRNLVDLMGGEIGVESREGEGSTFRFTVSAPRSQAPATDLLVAPDEDEPMARPRAILVADDVAANRELVRAMLEALGHEVREAVGGAEAVEAAGEARFDLIFMDMQMPGVDGLAATRAIRAAPGPNQSTPIVALTANVLSTQIEACLAAGMDDHMAKPIAPLELLRKIAFWADGEAVSRRSA